MATLLDLASYAQGHLLGRSKVACQWVDGAPSSSLSVRVNRCLVVMMSCACEASLGKGNLTSGILFGPTRRFLTMSWPGLGAGGDSITPLPLPDLVVIMFEIAANLQANSLTPCN